MKNKIQYLKNLSLACLLLLGLCGCGNSSGNLIAGKWAIQFNPENKSINIYQDSVLIADALYASYQLDKKQVATRDYSTYQIKTSKIKDSFGKGHLYTIIYKDEALPTLTQYFYLYPNNDYLLTEFTLEDNNGVASNRMAPVQIDRMPQILRPGENNRALFVPFDNDKWVRYQSHPLTFDKLTSYEVTAIFNNDNRQGLIVGSVEHDNWKTGITIGKGNKENVGSLACYGGIADELTRDVKTHGILKGKKIKSPKVLYGLFGNWCDGLEAYAKANAVIAPPKSWEKAVPFGWNSWGALQFSLTYEKALEVSDFFKENLQNDGFVNPDNTLYIGLDSGWNSFSEEQLKSFIDKCKANGQIGGIYWTPFTDWGKNPDRTIDAAPEYKYKDIYLYANGEPQELDGAYAIDPTHPAVEAMMKEISELFRRTGYEYVKMDFMTHGAMEADSWHNPEITTGIQGYNYGLKLLNQYFGDMYINLSISPVFPAQYAQSRRIACDAWNKIKDTEYTLNALSYGWWQKYIYQYNDADHIVLRDATEGENRARITSGVITGIYIVGDDFSKEGPTDSKERSIKLLTNKSVNAVATGEVFRPVEGNGAQSENIFIRKNEDGTVHCAIFNYSDNELNVTLSFERIGLDATKEYRLTELWSGETLTAAKELSLTIPAKDVKLIEMK
ncbi:alpha-galactosidase [Bacteroides sp. 224]|uniref:alpha-galactosidase n=1 Tax=Bacteroides sp. 224 TaxID=2302936 RepID=UPI0013D3D6CA|nr:alpha-galactosidase [Bacteroides sp. 224]NDV64263.1 alpha-galactosidase [Bacteroides sp. 224]